MPNVNCLAGIIKKTTKSQKGFVMMWCSMNGITKLPSELTEDYR